jgi:hypothetical protein
MGTGLGDRPDFVQNSEGQTSPRQDAAQGLRIPGSRPRMTTRQTPPLAIHGSHSFARGARIMSRGHVTICWTSKSTAPQTQRSWFPVTRTGMTGGVGGSACYLGGGECGVHALPHPEVAGKADPRRIRGLLAPNQQVSACSRPGCLAHSAASSGRSPSSFACRCVATASSWCSRRSSCTCGFAKRASSR